MPLTNLSECMAYKNMQWDVVEWDNSGNNKNKTVIEGRWKPGDTKRNIINDGDVKLWTSTGSVSVAGGASDDGASPTMTEVCTLNFWRAPLAYSAALGCNIQIELKYIVQFKDLRQQARYPNTVTTNQDIVQTLNETRIIEGSALQRWI